MTNMGKLNVFLILQAVILGASLAETFPGMPGKPGIPGRGAYIGGILNRQETVPAGFNGATGVKHAAFLTFFEFPAILDQGGLEYQKITAFINNCKNVNAIPALTLETLGGLTSYGYRDIEKFADYLVSFGTPMILRWNHEMNGSWYPWGQQPSLYIQKFREFADVIHRRAPNVAMAWTPNQAWGYPWHGLPFQIPPSHPDYSRLDTNGNGHLEPGDDAYTPYYPGDAYVDWVGVSFYHWGEGVRGINVVPPAYKFARSLGYNNEVPNFHSLFALGHGKPMMVAETSAFYDLGNIKGGGASESEIKKAWMAQVYNVIDNANPRIDQHFPAIKLIFWFSIIKYETEVGGVADWRCHANSDIAGYYRYRVSDPYFLKAP